MTTPRDTDIFISELIELLAMQEKEIQRLERKVSRIMQYVEVYEEYIRGE